MRGLVKIFELVVQININSCFNVYFQCYYIVVDTNVLIRELDLINELKDTPLDGKNAGLRFYLSIFEKLF